MKLISWNLNQRSEAWRHLAELMDQHDVTVAMVQEAKKPPQEITERLRVFGDPSLGEDPWRLPVPTQTRRRFASGIVVRGAVPIEIYETKPIGDTGYRMPAISHPGQWVVAARIGSLDGMWVVSLYGIWDDMADTGDIYAEATLHRAISDLTPLLQLRAAKQLVRGGDINVWHGYGKKRWVDRYRTVFDRLAAYDLDMVGPFREGDTPLKRCPCGGDAEKCRHVRTYSHQRRIDSTPYQNDYMFARGVRVLRCVALDDEVCWACSDHCPILLEAELD